MLPSIAGALSGLLAASLPGNVPSPALAPAEVVRVQLRALAGDDPRGHYGIRRTFRFASPDNQAVTGPVDRFVDLVQGPAYAPLLNARRSRLLDERRDGDAYQTVVELVDRDGRTRLYGFQLGRQAEGQFKGCWMTEGVTPLDPAPAPPDGRGII